MNIHTIQALCLITWRIKLICKFNKVFHTTDKWTTHDPGLDVGCPVLRHRETLRHQHCLALVHRTCGKLHFVQTWRRLNQPWGLRFFCATESQGIRIYVTRQNQIQIFPCFCCFTNLKGFLEKIRIRITPPFLSHFTHLSEDSTDDHRMQGLMLNIFWGLRMTKSSYTSELEKSIVLNWIEFYHRKYPVNGHKPESNCVETVAIPVSGHFLQEGWGLGAGITEHQFLEMTTVN